VWVVGDETKKGTESLSSFKQAMYFKEIGFNVHDTMLFKKKNPIPQNHNRYEQCFEYMFVFVKGRLNTFNPIMVDTKNKGKSFDWGRDAKMDDKQCRRVRGTDIIKVKSQKIHENIFEYYVGGDSMGHPAVFPYQLAEDMVRSWSNEGDTVLDPFMGSGTTGLACMNTNRNFIGIEIYPRYYEMSKSRLKNTVTATLL
jgi:site-specific DNA-methyltransferase (adenine-specific)